MTDHHIDRHLACSPKRHRRRGRRGGNKEGVAAVNAPHERYQIRVAGQLAPRWAASFDGMTISPADDNATDIRGRVADQAALHAIFRTLADLGLTIISVAPMAED